MYASCQPGGLAAEKPGRQTEGGPQRCCSAAEEEAHRHYRFHPRPAQEHAVEAPRTTGTSTQTPTLTPFIMGDQQKPVCLVIVKQLSAF